MWPILFLIFTFSSLSTHCQNRTNRMTPAFHFNGTIRQHKRTNIRLSDWNNNDNFLNTPNGLTDGNASFLAWCRNN